MQSRLAAKKAVRMGKSKILLIANNLSNFGGGERWVLEVASELKKKHEVSILNLTSKADTTRVPLRAALRNYGLKKADVSIAECIGVRSKVFGSENFILLVPKPGALSAMHAKIRDTDTVYIITSNPLALSYVIALCSLYRKKLIFGVHIPFLKNLLSSNSTAGTYRFLLGKVREFHVLNRDDESLIRSRFKSAKVHLIPNFIPSLPVLRNSKNKKKFIVLFVGRLETQQKGIDLLSEIVARTIKKNPRISFHILGKSGDGQGIVLKLALRYPGRVLQPGFVSERRLAEEYQRASLFICTSRYESFGLSVLEAQSFGLPVVSFRISGPVDILRSTIQGATVAPFDTVAFSDRILWYYNRYACNPEDRISDGKQIRMIVAREYGKELVMAKLEKLLSGKGE